MKCLYALLIVLSLIILILVLVLTVPLRYRLKGCYHDSEARGEFKLNFMGGLIGLRASLGGVRGPGAYISICGIRIYDLWGEHSGADKEPSAAASPDIAGGGGKARPDLAAGTPVSAGIPRPAEGERTARRDLSARTSGCGALDTSRPAAMSAGPSSRESVRAGQAESTADTGAKTPGDRAARPENRAGDKTENSPEHNAGDKTRGPAGYIDTLKSLIILYRDPRYADARSLLTDRAKSLIHEIAPRRGYMRMRLGLDDPAATAQVCEAYVMLMPLIGERVELIPDFGGQAADADCDIRGRLRPVLLIYTAVRILSSRGVKRMSRRIVYIIKGHEGAPA